MILLKLIKITKGMFKHWLSKTSLPISTKRTIA